MKLSCIMKVGLFVGVIGAILFTTNLTRAQAQQFFVWEKISPCQDTRQDWFTVAQTYPGESVSTNAWQQAAGPFDTFAAAMAAADTAKMGPFIVFKNRCCNDWAVWRNSQTNQFSVARTTAGPQPPPLMLERGDLCCEEAFAQAGLPVGSIRDCRNLQLSTGATVTVLPNGTFVPAQGGGGGGGTGYIGCYKDTSDFDLKGHLERSSQNTPQRCIQICREKCFAYAGVQYGESCLCGNSYGKYGTADNCNYKCTGDSSQICGGYASNSVYTTGATGGSSDATEDNKGVEAT